MLKYEKHSFPALFFLNWQLKNITISIFFLPLQNYLRVQKVPFCTYLGNSSF